MCSAAIVLAPIRPQRSSVMIALLDDGTGAAPQEARTISVVGHSTVSGSKSPLAIWRIKQLRRARAEVAPIHGDAGQGGKRVPGFLDVVEADDAEVVADQTPDAAERARSSR